MTPEALVLCTLARHGLLGTDLPDMLDLWPEVAVVKVVCDPKPATARKHPGERICARCNHWAPNLEDVPDGMFRATCHRCGWIEYHPVSELEDYLTRGANEPTDDELGEGDEFEYGDEPESESR